MHCSAKLPTNLILILCLFGAGGLAAALFIFKVPLSNLLTFGLLLLCPLMHIIMMKGQSNHNHQGSVSKERINKLK